MTATLSRPSAAEPTSAPIGLSDLQGAYVVGMSPLIELGGFRPTVYWEFDVVGFDLARAERAADGLVRRHEQLRTVVLADGRPQVLDEHEVPPVRLPVVDLTGLAEPARAAELARIREQLCDVGVDPASWPMFDIRVSRLRRHRARVHVAMSLLLLDARSVRLLVDEWRLRYHDPAAELPPVELTQRDVLALLRANEDSDDYREHWRYWQDRLATLPEAPLLPSVTRSGPVRMVRRGCVLTPTEWRALCARFRRHRIMPNAALLHVLAETLGAWAAEPRFCLNVLHHGPVTSRPELEGVVGQLAATLPVEVELDADPDFWARAGRTQQRLWADLAHGDVSAVRLTRELAARRGWTSQAVLPYVFNNMLGNGMRPTTVPGLRCRTVHNRLRTPQVLVDNQLQDAPDGGVLCVWDTVDDAFPPGLVDTMFAAYERLLRQLCTSDQVDVVSPAHRAVVDRLNPPPAAVPTGRLEDGFLAQAAARPDAVAVLTDEGQLTYRELESRSRAVARWLAERGVGPGVIVPVVLTKGWAQVVAVLGVLRAGAAYCPVDAALPAERVRYLIEQCGAPVYLTQSEIERAGPTDEPAPARPTGDALAYVIHTSGSTGRPKGVMISHHAALNTIVAINDRVALAPDDRVFGISSLSFDLSVWDVFGALAAGAALVLPAATANPDPAGWARIAASYRATVWNSVPMLAELLAEALDQAELPAGPPPLRVFLLSGDWIPTTLPDRLRSAWPGARLIGLGGATEASIWSNSYEIGVVDPAWRSIPYGTPLRNQTMRVLDHRMDVRQPGATGRIYIGGVGVAEGYLHDPVRTEERFVRHPGTGERLYWTGDLGRYWPDGTIEFLGREDRQTKIQGFRIEPGEVEAALRGHPEVRECAVGVARTRTGQRQLVALVVAETGHQAEPTAIAGYLRARLPGYLVPARIQLVGALPLSANGKVDVGRALAELPDPTDDHRDPSDAAGDDRLVGRLAALVAELLDLRSADPDTNFFTEGGNSLLALRLIGRIRRELGVTLPLRQIFATPTVGALAACVADGADPGRGAVVLSSTPGTELVLFHPVGGSVSCYPEFAAGWPGPVIAFQNADRTEAGPASLVELAAEYRAELQRRTPVGPYLLGGWSMGGVLAHEVARQLAEHGQHSPVVLIDSDVTNRRRPATPEAGEWEFLRDLGGGRLPDGLTVEDADPRAAAVAAGLLPADLDAEQYARLVRVHNTNLAALADYQPGPSAAPTLLFVAGADRRADPVPAWRALCPRLDVETWPADHYSLVRPDRMAAVRDRLRAWLTRPE